MIQIMQYQKQTNEKEIHLILFNRVDILKNLRKKQK
jgi:hypothetical protein